MTAFRAFKSLQYFRSDSIGSYLVECFSFFTCFIKTFNPFLDNAWCEKEPQLVVNILVHSWEVLSGSIQVGFCGLEDFFQIEGRPVLVGPVSLGLNFFPVQHGPQFLKGPLQTLFYIKYCTIRQIHEIRASFSHFSFEQYASPVVWKLILEGPDLIGQDTLIFKSMLEPLERRYHRILR